jgi:hypothetical protein
LHEGLLAALALVITSYVPALCAVCILRRTMWRLRWAQARRSTGRCGAAQQKEDVPAIDEMIK